MRKDPVEDALNEIAELRGNPEAGPRMAALLRSKSNLVVSKAARAAGELGSADLKSPLAAAFHRLMENPAKLDKGCLATIAIVHALYGLDYDLADVYLRGIHHVQREAAFGPPVDVAAPLRSACALGLLRTRHPDALFEVEALLVDEEMIVRSAAARAIGTWGHESGELLLRLKVLASDEEPDVLGECFTGLLSAGTERSLNFVGGYLDSADDGVAEAAILALGASREPRAMELLIGKWHRTAQRPMRKVLLLAFASARQEPAFDFLLGLVANENAQTAADAVAALQVCKNDERIMQRVAEALAQRDCL